MDNTLTLPTISCPYCNQEFTAPAESAVRAVQCPHCEKWVTTDQARSNFAEAEAKEWRTLIKFFSVVLLLGGLATLCGCWLYHEQEGMLGGGFLAVVGAILFSRK